MNILTTCQMSSIQAGNMDEVDKHNLCLILGYAGTIIGLVSMVNPASLVVVAVAGGIGGFASMVGMLTC